MAGRRKKAQSSKALTDDNTRRAVPVHIPAEAPPMPEYIRENVEMSAVWIEVVTDMDRLHILSKTDSGTVEAYCICLERMRRLQTRILLEGESFQVKTKSDMRRFKNPDVDTLQKTIQQLKGFAAELGCTPGSRGKVSHLLQADLFGGKESNNAWNGF